MNSIAETPWGLELGAITSHRLVDDLRDPS